MSDTVASILDYSEGNLTGLGRQYQDKIRACATKYPGDPDSACSNMVAAWNRNSQSMFNSPAFDPYAYAQRDPRTTAATATANYGWYGGKKRLSKKHRLSKKKRLSKKQRK